DPRGHLLRDPRMNDAVEGLALRGVVEHARGQRLAVERAAGADRAGEPAGDLLVRGLAGLDHLARDLVGIDHRHAARRQQPGDGALPRADVAGQSPDAHHESVTRAEDQGRDLGTDEIWGQYTDLRTGNVMTQTGDPYAVPRSPADLRSARCPPISSRPEIRMLSPDLQQT